ncbi:unnamed protein product [Owenia fusiformis]|uniref:Uncharacterized protein n=1 Tax=Owenia fusiformis TaxID=6347 RepID=A0A8J1T6D6_OWEFU|nr:unnamed protein product [Owenia fusiformis]
MTSGFENFANLKNIEMPLKLPRERLLSAVNVILRVPALFIAEIWYRTDLKTAVKLGSKKGESVLDMEKTNGKIIILSVYYFAILFAALLMILPLKRLVNLYMYIVSSLLICGGSFLSMHYVAIEKENQNKDVSVFEDKENIEMIGFNLIVQGAICATVTYLLELKHWSRFTLLAYTLPVMARIASIPAEDLHRVHNFSTFVICVALFFFVLNNLGRAIDIMRLTLYYAYLQTQVFGWISFTLLTCAKVLLPAQFLTFWLVMILVQLYLFVITNQNSMADEGWLIILLASTGECCATPISLIGTCFAVSYTAFIVLALTKLFLQGYNAFMMDNVMHQGWTEGFTMFLLAIQTDLITLKSAQRAFLMSIILFIVLSSLIQSMYEVADPILLSLSASHNKSIIKHGKVVLLCTFLWMFPLYMSISICKYFDIDFWLLVILSSCVLTSVQVLGSLLVYGLFMYDSLRHEPWERLDDLVFYAKATTRMFEFLVAVIVVFYGVRETLFGSWSWVNVSILIIHFYFNVWSRMQQGWRSYLLRRKAAAKIASLPDASEVQLKTHNDVCAICFQDMRIAKLTKCHHFFHGLCLKKWLYVQENCPMCHQKIDFGGESEDTNNANGAGDAVNIVQENVENEDNLQANVENENIVQLQEDVENENGAQTNVENENTVQENVEN